MRAKNKKKSTENYTTDPKRTIIRQIKKYTELKRRSKAITLFICGYLTLSMRGCEH
jgi:hypothetical protein